MLDEVATVLTVYGIETIEDAYVVSESFARLQQYLPFTVLKLHTHLFHLFSFPHRCNSTYRLRY